MRRWVKSVISDVISSDYSECQSCFWCASYISPQIPNRITKQVITKCPSCIEEDIESLPIAKNEEYRFGYDTKRGVAMEFLR